MQFSSRLFLPLAALCAFSTARLPAADAIELKQRWIVGKQYFQTTHTQQESSITIGPQKIDQAISTTMETSQTVRPHEDGKRKRMTLKYERVSMDMSMNGQKFSFDSSKPDQGSDPLGFSKSMGAIAGKELKIILSEKDEVTELENYDEFIKQMGPTSMPGMDISKMFTKESLAQMMKQGALQAMPDHPVAPGESWPFSTEITLPQLGKVGVKGTYTLKAIADHAGVQCAEIYADANVALDFSGGDATTPAGQALAQLGMKLEKGTLKGTVWFDPKLGFAREAQLMQEMTMTMKNPSDPSATLTVPLKQKIDFVLTKVEDAK